MVSKCAVKGCSNDSRISQTSFHKIPSIVTQRGEKLYDLSIKRRELVIDRIRRPGWTPSETTRICSDHYISGKPAKLTDPTHPDWLPSQKLGNKTLKNVPQVKRRSERLLKKGNCQEIVKADAKADVKVEKKIVKVKKANEIQCQTDLTSLNIQELLSMNNRLREENTQLKEQQMMLNYDIDNLLSENLREKRKARLYDEFEEELTRLYTTKNLLGGGKVVNVLVQDSTQGLHTLLTET